MRALTREQRMLVQSVREIAESEFADDAFEHDREIPEENIKHLAEQGFYGVNYDPEYGGGGMSEFDALLMIEAVGRVCPDTARMLATQQLSAPRAIHMFGTEAAKERYLTRVTAGDIFICIAISEPEAGSDVTSMTTQLSADGDDYVLNGEKIWVSFVEQAEAAVVWTQLPEGGIGSVVMDFDAPGVEVHQYFDNMAGHRQAQLFFEDVPIPAENLLVGGRDQFREQLNALNWERVGAAAQCNMLALAAYDRALEYAGDREQFGQPIGDFQGIQWKLADMTKQLSLSREFAYEVANEGHEAGYPVPIKASIANLFASEMADYVINEALQIHGANGYQQGHPIEYLYRLARGYRIAAGTEEIQKNTIAGMLEDGDPFSLG